jgi:hypothetical protein
MYLQDLIKPVYIFVHEKEMLQSGESLVGERGGRREGGLKWGLWGEGEGGNITVSHCRSPRGRMREGLKKGIQEKNSIKEGEKENKDGQVKAQRETQK